MHPQAPARPGLPLPPAARHQLGYDLRTFREQRSLTIASAAACIDIAAPTLSRIETGQAPIRTSYLYPLLDLYGITDPGQREHFADLAREGQRQPYWTEYDGLIPPGTARCLALETAATLVRTYAPQHIPDHVATPAYTTATAALAHPDLRRPREEDLAAITLARQQHLYSGACRLHVLIDQTALHDPAVPGPVRAQQHRYLAAFAAFRTLTIQVIPATAASPVLSPPFTLLTIPGQAHDTGCYHGPAGHLAPTRRRADVRGMNATWQALTRTAEDARHRDTQAAQLRHRIKEIDAAEDAHAREIEHLTALPPGSPAITALRTRILDRFTELEDERTRISTQLAKLTAENPAPADPALLDHLPHLAGHLTSAPAALQQQLYRAFQIQMIYNPDGDQVTCHATITTPHTLAAILTDSEPPQPPIPPATTPAASLTPSLHAPRAPSTGL
jgi:transcriptional regulator with XRE-family HTH domain